MERWILVTFCGECKEPIPLDVWSLLEYNPGISGHPFKTEAEALEAWELTKQAIFRHGYFIESDGNKLLPRGMENEVEIEQTQRGTRIYHIDAYQDVKAIRVTLHWEIANENSTSKK
jgi:hypothetical protein